MCRCKDNSLRKLITAMLLMLPLAGHGHEFVCSDSRAVIGYGDDEYRDTASMVCEAIGQALAFMASSGFAVDVKLRVEVADEVPPDCRVHPFGTYDRRSGAVRALSWESFAAACSEQPLFGQPPDPDLYRSLIVHEVAHAIADRNFQFPQPSRTAHEYIAYVVQLAVMPADLRNRILEHLDVNAFAGPGEISWTYLALNPEAFAAKCYLHYSESTNGDAFLAKLLSGEVLLSDDLWPY